MFGALITGELCMIFCEERGDCLERSSIVITFNGDIYCCSCFSADGGGGAGDEEGGRNWNWWKTKYAD